MGDLPFLGPPLAEGPLPAVFYFALSAQDSLFLAPYNQPALFLANAKLRIFSLNIPYHGPGLDKRKAMDFWTAALSRQENIVASIVQEAKSAINDLIKQKVIDPKHIGVMGLSRGAFIATHLAAHDTRISTLLGFAPLVSLEYLPEFHTTEHAPLIAALSLEHVVPALLHKQIRYYIGNRDTRVGTEHCFSLIHHLANAAYDAGLHSPPHELVIVPSIGHKGHGTAKETFQEGTDWLKKKLHVN